MAAAVRHTDCDVTVTEGEAGVEGTIVCLGKSWDKSDLFTFATGFIVKLCEKHTDFYLTSFTCAFSKIPSVFPN